MKITDRLTALRQLMKANRIHAYLVPSTDPHGSEYVPSLWRRREWISGFTGSAGDVAVTEKKAALWTDGRYWLQAEAQLAGSGIALLKQGMAGTPSVAQWLAKSLKKGQHVGVDPRLFSTVAFRRFASELADKGLVLVSVETNLIDQIWEDRPAPPEDPIEVYPVKLAGERFQDKLKRLRKAMAEVGTDAHIITSMDQIAWLFNIRGNDVLYNPFVIGYAVVTARQAMLFVLTQKVTKELIRTFGKSVEIREYNTFRSVLMKLSKSGATVWVDPNTANQWIVEMLAAKAQFHLRESPLPLMKSQKNTAELRGMKQAHVRDGVAMVRFLSWFEKAIETEPMTEISVADKLEEFRSRSRLMRGLSFDSIVGYAEHGAIIHYSATPETCSRIRRRGLLLIDSGAQYVDGTTDITRTIALSKPTNAQKEQFTRVLKGHIQIVTAVFPLGTSGRQLDTLARKALWDAGYDYAHGTGHGVGAYLSVHEGPQSISHSRDTGVALMPGMVCSNEPGFYKSGEYGIRIENLVYVTKDPAHSTADRTWLTFDNLTLCPIDRNLIDPRLLTPAELRYLNGYHQRVREALTPHLDAKEASWLAKATRPIR